MYNFFYPDGTLAEQEDFVDFYSKTYYYLNRDRQLENKILDILHSDKLSEEDIITILRWKIGEITDDDGQKVVGTPYTKIDTKEICRRLTGTKNEVERNVTLDEIRNFRNLDGKRFGDVYAITMKFFLTNGKLPIYDRFAHIALKVIYEHSPFESVVTDSQLDREFRKGSDNIEKDYNDNYVSRLESIFGTRYVTDRRIDQALWVYGHLFNDTKTNKKKITI